MNNTEQTPLLRLDKARDFNERHPESVPNEGGDTSSEPEQSPSQQRNEDVLATRSSPLDIIRSPFAKQEPESVIDIYKDRKSFEEHVYHQQRLEEAQLKKQIEDNRVQEIKAFEEVKHTSLSPNPKKKSSGESVAPQLRKEKPSATKAIHAPTTSPRQSPKRQRGKKDKDSKDSLSLEGSLRDARESEGETIIRSPRESRERGKRRQRAKKKFEKAFEAIPMPAVELEDKSLGPETSTATGHEMDWEVHAVPLQSPDVLLTLKAPTDKAKSDSDFRCMVARSALVSHFSYSTMYHGMVVPNAKLYWLDQLTKQVYISRTLRQVNVWKWKEHLPKEVADLNPLFRQVMSWGQGDVGGPPKTWTCHRLVLNEVILHELFSDAKLHTVQNSEQVTYNVKIESIELLLYPLGSGLLVMNVNWLESGGHIPIRRALPLAEIRTILFVAKYRQKVEGIAPGWSFTSDSHPLSEDDIPREHRECLGEKLMAAKYSGKPVSLSSIGNWLLHHPKEDPNQPPLRLDVERHAYHHSTVILNDEPPKDILQEYLFHLRRAFGQTNRPPPSSEMGERTSRTLVWRINRYVGISREGAVSISWPLDPVPLSFVETNLEHGAPTEEWKEVVQKSFELREWHKKFQGIYLLLDLHSFAEKLVFMELSDLVASQVEDLQLNGHPTLTDFEMVKASRSKLRDLSSRMVRYTLSMSSNDCGGITEYSEFFTSLREVFGIPELRDELSNELKDVLALLESHYLEEEKRQRDLQEQHRLEENRLQKEAKERKDRKDQLFGVVVSIIGSLTLPYAIVGSVFGMNLNNLPEHIDFYGLMGVTFAVSVLTLILLLMLRFINF